MSNSSTQDAGNQALLLHNPVHPDTHLLTGLWEELGSCFSTRENLGMVPEYQSWGKNASHTSEIMRCLIAQFFAALDKRSTGAFEPSDVVSCASRFHKCTGYTNPSSKGLIRKLPFIIRAPISYFNYTFFFYTRIVRQRLWPISEPSILCCSVKHPSVIGGIAMVEKPFLKKLSEDILRSLSH